MRIYLCLIIVNSREFISVKAFTSKLKFLVSTLILTFFFFCWTIIRTRIENKRLLKKKKKFPEIVTFLIIRYFHLYFIVHDYSV